MALTTAELQANLIAQQQAEAANIVALIESIVDGRLSITDVDLNALALQIQAVNDLLDGDANTAGFQSFQALVARVVALETASATQAASIAALQSLLTTQAGTLQAASDALSVERARIDALAASDVNHVTRDELSDDMKAAGQGFINRLWQGRTRPTGLPNTDGTTS